MAKHSVPTLVLVTGTPGSGKSTLSKALAPELGAAVLGWDWGMAALTGFETVMAGVRALSRVEYRRLGWQILWSFAESELRSGRSVIVDGVARSTECESVRELAARYDAASVVALLSCEDLAVVRDRVEGRRREIPGWQELTWHSVQTTLANWLPPDDVDVAFDTASGPPVDEMVRAVLEARDLRAGS
ncbi:MAG: AAA family ATPase [Acidimicrobiales bacterium]